MLNIKFTKFNCTRKTVSGYKNPFSNVYMVDFNIHHSLCRYFIDEYNGEFLVDWIL